MSEKLRIIPLGGFGEVGKNMLAYEFDGHILIVDTGMMFPDNDMIGIDYIIPDFDYLTGKEHLVDGIIITHGHEDHIGAIHHVYSRVPAPIFATELTLGLVDVKMARASLGGKADLRRIAAGDKVQIGKFQVEFFHVSHSIPDAVGLGITTKAGLVVHTGDFKFDQTPVDGWPTDFAKLAEFSTRGVDILLSDSTNAERRGWTPSEKVITPAFEDCFLNAKGRVIVATFASQISRIQQIADAAMKYGRKISFVGTSMVDNSRIARNLGYLIIPDDKIVPIDAALKLPDDKLTIICTGSQGEPSSIIGRLSAGSNRQFDLKAGDTVVLSAHPIPGNEEAVSKTINRMLRIGAEVIHGGIAPVHVSGHASQEEQKMMISLVKPRHFVPMHGELRQLKQHAKLAIEMGIPEKNILIVENGQVVQYEKKKLSLGERIPGGYIVVEGGTIGESNPSIQKERELLAKAGIFIVNLSVDKYTNRLLDDPEILTRGFVSSEDAVSLIASVKKRVIDVIHTGGMSVERDIVDVVKTFLYNETKRRPMVFVTMTRG